MSAAPRIGVLAVQGDVREHLAVLASLGAQAVGVRRVRELDDVDALVIPGGESTTMDKLVRAFELYGPLRERIEAGMPAYGSCAGMIMLADRIADARPDQQTLGGLDITVRRNAFGRQVDSFEEDLHMPALSGSRSGSHSSSGSGSHSGAEPASRAGSDEHQGEERDRPVRAVFIRAPWVEQVGEDVQVLATVEAGPARGRVVAVRQGNLLATSFHPEVTGDTRVHGYFVELVRASQS